MMPGIGAMLHYLGGGSEKSASDYYGRKIASARVDSDAIILRFDDGVSIAITDKGQSCCESRYLTVEDDIKWLEGKTLRSIDVTGKDGPEDSRGDYHDIAFLEIKVEDGLVGCSFHNEHNGYYGGFGLNVEEVASS